MYGHRGGDKTNCVYPTVQNVREQFYKAYPGEPAETFDMTRGDIPLISEGKFRYKCHYILFFSRSFRS